MERSLHSRFFPIYPFPIGIILVHYTRYFCRVFPGKQKLIRIHDRLSAVVGYLRTSVQSNERDAEPFRLPLVLATSPRSVHRKEERDWFETISILAVYPRPEGGIPHKRFV